MSAPNAADALRALITLAAATADGDPDRLADAVAAVIDAGIPPREVDELMLQSVLTVGWPRTLVAAALWRQRSGVPAVDGGDLDYAAHDEWTRRGEATCKVIYGRQYQRLRESLRAMHPALEAWVVTEGYGRTLSRPGLAMARRELCTVAQTVVLRTSAQMHSHLLGALRAGASPADVEMAVRVGGDFIDVDAREALLSVWHRVRDARVSVS